MWLSGERWRKGSKNKGGEGTGECGRWGVGEEEGAKEKLRGQLSFGNIRWHSFKPQHSVTGTIRKTPYLRACTCTIINRNRT